MQNTTVLNVITILWKHGTVRRMTQIAETWKKKKKGVYYECSNYCLNVKRVNSTNNENNESATYLVNNQSPYKEVYMHGLRRRNKIADKYRKWLENN